MKDACDMISTNLIPLNKDELNLHYEYPSDSDVVAWGYMDEPIGAHCFVQFASEDNPRTEYVSFGYYEGMKDCDYYGMVAWDIWQYVGGEGDLIPYCNQTLYEDGINPYVILSYKLKYVTTAT